jgi:V/A-type H+-transporting ATPase subunit D
MAKIKLTKNELKKQKDALKMYKRYLPTLQLKKQQLQMEIRGIEARAKSLAEEREILMAKFREWIAVFGEESALKTDSGDWLLSVREIRTSSGNIAGVEIPVYAGADFVLADYDLFVRPLWIDKALERLKTMLELDLEIKVLEEQITRLARELRVTTQG